MEKLFSFLVYLYSALFVGLIAGCIWLSKNEAMNTFWKWSNWLLGWGLEIIFFLIIAAVLMVVQAFIAIGFRILEPSSLGVLLVGMVASVLGLGIVPAIIGTFPIETLFTAIKWTVWAVSVLIVWVTLIREYLSNREVAKP